MWIHSKIPKRDREDMARARGKRELCFIQLHFTLKSLKFHHRMICHSAYFNVFFEKYAIWHI